TQQFNTTTSMGRLMLNILLSFAQFEREVTGERIRDKIAASKRKGMWTRLDAIWDQLFPAEQTRIVKLLVEKVIVSPNDLEVRLRANGIERLVLELRPERVEQTEEALE